MVYGHELQDQARMLQSVWIACGLLVNAVADHWSEKRSLLYWCADHMPHCAISVTL